MIDFPKCNLKESCLRCGYCCHFRTKQKLSQDEESEIRNAIYSKTDIIYLDSLNKITISITKKEKDTLLLLSKKLNKNIRIKPLKTYICKKNNNTILKILDYYIDSDICPFYDDKTNICEIYENRPKICKIFPNYLNNTEKIKNPHKSNSIKTVTP